jgi:hypothetical protein
MLNKKYLVGVGIAVIIGIAVTVYGYSTSQQASTANNSVGVSDNVQATKTPANATGKHFSVQFSESMGVSNKP